MFACHVHLKSTIAVTVACMAIIATDRSAHGTLVAYWSFDGATVPPRLEEKLGNSALDATEVGANAWNTRAGFGEVLANGLNDPYLSVPDNSLIDFGTESFSASIWTFRTSDSSMAKGIFDKNGTSTAPGYLAIYTPDNTLRLRLDGTGATGLLVDTIGTHYSPNQWQNVIVTVDRTANVAKIFVDGVESTGGGVDISGLGDITSTVPLFISTLNGDPNFPARGRLDDFGLFNHVLTSAQIAAINADGGQPLSSINFVDAVPEPSTIVLSLMGVALLVLNRRNSTQNRVGG